MTDPERVARELYPDGLARYARSRGMTGWRNQARDDMLGSPALSSALPNATLAAHRCCSVWHPLRPAVDAGRVRVPGLSGAEEREMLQTVAGLYAQTINLSGIEGGELPAGLEGVAMVTHLTHEEMMRAMGAGR